MERNEILEIVRKHTLQTVRDLPPERFSPSCSLADLGADSLDIVDIVTASLRELRVRVPREKLNEAKNIQELVDIVAEHGTAVS